MAMKKLIAYIRVSTRKQERSGLGLEAQMASVEQYAQSVGGVIVKVYIETETGKIADRPELQKALAHAKCIGATLVVAKLDRLARNVEFTAALMNSGADFVACDNPTANRLTIHILAAVAEDEARRISERTRAALQAYKRRGGLLGASLPQCRNLDQGAREKGAAAAGRAVHQLASAAYLHILPLVEQLRSEGNTLEVIASKLNSQGYSTRRGKSWNPTQVMRVLERAN
jgi:DNA invertase Pin-like site-specific DNA recombinase